MSFINEYVYHFKKFNRNIKSYLVFNTLYRVSLTLYVLYFPRYLLLLGYNEEQLAKMTALSTLGMAAMGLFAGLLSDRIGRRKSFLYGVTISKVAFFLRGFFTILPAMYISYAINGVFGVLFMAATAPFIYENTAKTDRMHAFSYQAITMRIAGILGNILGGYLPAVLRVFLPDASDLLIYRIVFGLALGLTIYGIRLLFQIEDPQKVEVSTSSQSKTKLFQLNIPKTNMKFLVKYISSEALLGFGAAHFMPFITMYMINQFAATESAVGWIRSFAMIIVIVGVTMAPGLADRWGLSKSIIVTRILALPLLLGMAYAPNLLIFALVYALRNTFQQMSGPINRNFMMANLDAQTRATANGLLSTIRSGVRSVGTLSAGYLITQASYQASFLVAFAAYAISSLLFYVFFVRDGSAEEKFKTAS